MIPSRIQLYPWREVTFHGHTCVSKETVHFDGYTNLSLIHAREETCYCSGWRDLLFVEDWSGLRRGLKNLAMEEAAFEEGSCN
jgi:hypothetical protein